MIARKNVFEVVKDEVSRITAPAPLRDDFPCRRRQPVSEDMHAHWPLRVLQNRQHRDHGVRQIRRVERAASAPGNARSAMKVAHLLDSTNSPRAHDCGKLCESSRPEGASPRWLPLREGTPTATERGNRQPPLRGASAATERENRRSPLREEGMPAAPQREEGMLVAIERALIYLSAQNRIGGFRRGFGAVLLPLKFWGVITLSAENSP